MSIDAHTLILLREYCEHVDAMASGLYDRDDMHTLESERILLHDELCSLLSVDRRVDMYRRARMVLIAARGSNQQ